MAARRNSVTDGADSLLQRVRRKNHRANLTEQFVLLPATTKHREKLAQANHYAFLMQVENAAAIHALADRVRTTIALDAATLGHVLSPMDKHRFRVWSAELEAILTEFVASENHDNDPIVQLLEKLQFVQESHVCLTEVAIDGRQLMEQWERAGVFDSNGESNSDDEDPHDDVYEHAPLVGDWDTQKRRKLEASYAYQCVRERAAARVIKRNTLQWVRSRVAFCCRVEELQVFGNTTAALMEELTMVSPLQRRTAVSSASNTSAILDLLKRKSHVTGAYKINFTDLMHYAKHLALFTVDHALRRVEELQIKRRLYESRCAIKLQAWWRKTREIVKGRRMLQLLAQVKYKQEQAQLEHKASEKESKAPPGGKAEGTGTSHKFPKTPLVKSSKAVHSASTSSVAKGESETTDAAAKARASRGAAGREAKAALLPTPPSTPKSSSKHQSTSAKRPSMPHAAKGDDSKDDRVVRAARAREARLRKAFEDELLKQKREDEEAARDTQDVEAAWKRFLETAKQDTAAEDLGGDGSRASTAASRASGRETASTPHANGAVDTEEWRSWSDSDDDASGANTSRGSHRNGTPRSTTSSRLSTPLIKVESSAHADPGTARVAAATPSALVKVVVAAKNGNRSPRRSTVPVDQAVAASDDAVSTTTDDTGGGETKAVAPDASPATPPAPSRRQLLLMEALEARKLRPKPVPGIGQLSRMMPFADLAAAEPPPQPRSQVSSRKLSPQPTTRRHLFEMEFQQTAVAADAGAALDLLFLGYEPLVAVSAEEAAHQPPRSIEREAAAAESSASPTRVVRAARVARMRAALQQTPPPPAQQRSPEPPQQVQQRPQQLQQPRDRRDDREPPRSMPVVFQQPVDSTNAQAQLVLRSASVSVSSHGDAQTPRALLTFDLRKADLKREARSTALPNTDLDVTKSKFGSHAEWLQSMGLGGTVAHASRSPRHPNRRHTSNESRETKLVESVAVARQSAAQRARRKRTQAHALPLLGRRPVATKPIEREAATTAAEPQERQTQPQVETPQQQQQQPSARSRSTSEQVLWAGERPLQSREDADARSDGLLTEHEDSDASASDSARGSESDATLPSEESEMPMEKDGAADSNVSRRHSSRRLRGSVACPRRSRNEQLCESSEAQPASRPRRWHQRPHKHSVEGHDNAASDSGDGGERQRVATQESAQFRPNVASLMQRLVPHDKRWSIGNTPLGQGQEDDATAEAKQPLEMEEEERMNERNGGSSGDSGSDDEDAVQQPDAAQTAAFEKLYAQYLGLLSVEPPLIVRP